ncbi:quinone oxidoreductase family protein [Pseudonocardia sp. CA-107938]|uniref:quinone oxidoreductase family protein n=1 Tax=Pseudonocardia sp. CA-107938 TaxID=3240021 RepID=UPI003D941777
MRRVRYHEYGGPEVLTVEEVEPPVPGEGQVLIRTEVIGGSFVDTAMRAGTSTFGQPPLPGSPHGDVVGTVEEVGPDVDPSWTGRRVAALVAADAYADLVVADADWLAPVPDGVDAAPASNLAMPGPVALLALRAGQVATGETVLVHAAAGNIGHLATQLAKLEGAGRVIATVGSAAKRDFVLAHGADTVVSLADADWAEQVRAAAPDGIDVALDSVGGATTATTLGLIAPRGRLVVYGAAGNELPDLPVRELLALRSVTGFGLLGFRAAFPDEARAHLAEIAEHTAAGRLRTAVAVTVPLSEPAKAHEALEDRTRSGRVLIIP